MSGVRRGQQLVVVYRVGSRRTHVYTTVYTEQQARDAMARCAARHPRAHDIHVLDSLVAQLGGWSR